MAVANSRLYQEYVEVVTKGTPNSRLFQQYIEVVNKGDPNLRLFQQYVEVITISVPSSRLYQQYVEVITNASTTTDVTPNNTLTISQTVLVHGIFSRTASNTLALSQDVVDTEISTDPASNTLDLDHSVDVYVVHNRDASNTISFSHDVEIEVHGSIFKDAENTLNLSQSVYVQLDLNIAIEQTLNLENRANRIISLSASNTLALSQDDTENKFHPESVHNDLVFTQDPEVEKDIVRSLISTLVCHHQALKNLVATKSVTNTATIHQTVSYTNSKYANSALVFSQTADFAVAKIGKNQFVLTQTVLLNTELGRDLHSLFQPFQTIHLGPNTFRRSLESEIEFTQVAHADVVRGAESSIVFTQSVTVDKVSWAEDVFAIYSDATYNANFGRSATNAAFFVQTIKYNRVKALSVASILSFEQTLKKQRIRIASAENTFNLSQELVKSRYFESLISEIAFAHDVEHERTTTQTKAQTLGFQQSVGLNKVLHLSVGNQLIFRTSFQKHVGFGGSGPGGGGTGTVTVPDTQVIVVKNLVVLRGTTRAITLPAPEFDDTDAFTGSINVVRFKTGGRKVYKKDTERRVLDYTFVLQSKKIAELKAFIREYNATPFHLENWKGEIWYVMFNTNPFAISEEGYWAEELEDSIVGKNKFRVSLSFEGVRLN